MPSVYSIFTGFVGLNFLQILTKCLRRSPSPQIKGPEFQPYGDAVNMSFTRRSKNKDNGSDNNEACAKRDFPGERLSQKQGGEENNQNQAGFVNRRDEGGRTQLQRPIR
jgi:hypothetical protein